MLLVTQKKIKSHRIYSIVSNESKKVLFYVKKLQIWKIICHMIFQIWSSFVSEDGFGIENLSSQHYWTRCPKINNTWRAKYGKGDEPPFSPCMDPILKLFI